MTEPIDLDKLSVALAASMVSAHRYLIQANQDLQDLYKGNDTLAGLTIPRFTLGDVAFDVPYVVDSIQSPELVMPPEVRITKDVTLTEAELSSLKRGASTDAQEHLQTLLADYTEVKKSLRTSSEGIRTAAARTLTTPIRLAPAIQMQEVTLAQLNTGASKAASIKLSNLLEDYEAARTSLVRIKEILAGGALPRLTVRIDAETMEKAPSSTIHRMTLKFGAQDQEDIKVQGQTLT